MANIRNKYEFWKYIAFIKIKLVYYMLIFEYCCYLWSVNN